MPDGMRDRSVEMFGPRLHPRRRRRHEGRRSPRSPAAERRGHRARRRRCTSATTAAASRRSRSRGLLVPGAVRPGHATTAGRIQRVDLADAARSPTSTPSATADPLRAPNDLVLRRPRRLLVHRPRHPRRRTQDQRPHRHLLRPARRLGHQREVVFPVDAPERHRPVARRRHALLGRDPHRPGAASGRSPRPASSPRQSVRPSVVPGRPARACSCSTRWPSTARATCASATLVNGGHHGDLARRRDRSSHVADRRPAHHQHLLRRRDGTCSTGRLHHRSRAPAGWCTTRWHRRPALRSQPHRLSDPTASGSQGAPR